MKKYYGPITMGIIALTLAAPAVHSTTVLADETNTAPTEEVTTKDTNTDEKTVADDADNSGDSNNSQTEEPKTDGDKNDQTYSGTINLVLDSSENTSIPVKVEFNKLDTYENKTLILNGVGFDGNSAILINKDGKSLSDTHSMVPMKINKGGKITVDPDYLNQDGQILTKKELSLTVEAVNNQVDQLINNSFINGSYDENSTQHFFSSDPEKLKALYSDMGNELKAEKAKLSADMTLDQLKQVEKNISEIVSKYTTTVGIQIKQTDDWTTDFGNANPDSIKKYNKNKLETSAESIVPVIPGAEVYFINYTGPARKEFISIKYNDDGTKIESAKVTDSKNNKIKTNTIASVWMENFVSGNPIQAVTTNNEPAETVPSHNNNNHSNNNNNNNQNNVNPVKPTTDNKPTNVHKVSNVTFFATQYSDGRLFDDNGNPIKDRSLAGNTQWSVDKFMTINDIVYGRVATNEWVKLSTGLRINRINETVKTNNDHITRLYHSNGKEVKNRALAKDTNWYSDMTSTMNGETVYRVATDEWATVNDLK